MSAKFLFFSGKGGVGKTSMACSTAVGLAEKGFRTLVVTTDPASNVADVFKQEIGHKVTPIAGVERLWAMEIDPDIATAEYKEAALSPMRELFPDELIKVMEEQLNSPCTAEMASFDKFIDFMEDPEYDYVIFDTAPTGHTIRLLELPVDWSRHIEESSKGSGQTCMGPVALLQESKAKYDRAIALLQDKSRTSFIFVVNPEATPIAETKRAAAELQRIGVMPAELIVNGLLPEEECVDPFFAKRRRMQLKYLGSIESEIDLPTRRVELKAHEIRGLEALRGLTGELLDGWEVTE